MLQQSRLPRIVNTPYLHHVVDMLSIYCRYEGYSPSVIRHSLYPKCSNRINDTFGSYTKVQDHFFSIKKSHILSMINEPELWLNKDITLEGASLSAAIYSSKIEDIRTFCEDEQTKILLMDNFELCVDHVVKLRFSDLVVNKQLISDINEHIAKNIVVRELLERGAKISPIETLTGIDRINIDSSFFNSNPCKVGRIPERNRIKFFNEIHRINDNVIKPINKMSLTEKLDVIYHFTSKTDKYKSFYAVQSMLRTYLMRSKKDCIDNCHVNIKLQFVCDVFLIKND